MGKIDIRARSGVRPGVSLPSWYAIRLDYYNDEYSRLLNYVTLGTLSI